MNPEDIVKAIPTEVVTQAYTDVASETLKEAGKIGVDLVKTLRLALLPIQYAAAWQDRVARHIRRSIDQVPPERRIVPIESVTLQIADRLRYEPVEQGDDDPTLARMYVNLLSRAMDRDRVSEAHPAFIQIISQMAPDEVLLLGQLAGLGLGAYMKRALSSELIWEPEERTLAKVLTGVRHTIDDDNASDFESMLIRIEDLQQPALFPTYLEHLVSLGLVSFANEPKHSYRGIEFLMTQVEVQFWVVRLSEFGFLFHRACLALDEGN